MKCELLAAATRDWPGPADRGYSGGVSEVLEQLRGLIHARQLFRSGERLVVAVSGGLDSMVLLEALHALAADARWSLTVAHFNHELRGEEAERDEAFVRAAAQQRGLDCVIERAGRALRERPRGVSLEMAARAARHRFLARVALERGATTVALAHQADDQIETALLRFLRGGGGDGLGGMKWISRSPADPRVWLVRPLLSHTRADLVAYAERIGLAWREDASNATIDFTRNWLRHRVFPRLRKRLGHGVTTAMLRSIEIVGAEADHAATVAREWLAGARRPAFDTLHVAVQRRVLALQLVALDLPLDFDLIEGLRTRPGTPRTVGPEVRVWRDEQGDVHAGEARSEFQSGRAAITLRGAAGEIRFGGVTVAWQITARSGTGRVVSGAGAEQFDADRVGEAITLRHWEPGDRFQPIGASRPSKLQDLFTNLKIARSERCRRVVGVATSGDVFWVEGLRMSEPHKITPATQRWLEWRWERPPAGGPQQFSFCTGAA